jgi:hypothetical protein
MPNPISTITGQQSANQYGFTDPYSTAQNMNSYLWGSNGGGGSLAGGPLGTYNANAGNVMSQIAGLSGPLQQTLSGIANYQANNSVNNVGSNFASIGALGSGAGAKAFGEASAQPFAQAQATLQQSQLAAVSNALQSLMGVSGGAYNAQLGQAGNLMEHTSGLVAPTYYTNPDYTAAQNEQAQQKGKANSVGSSILNSGLNAASGGASGGANIASNVLGGKGSTQQASSNNTGTSFYSPNIQMGAMPYYPQGYSSTPSYYSGIT